MEGEQFTIPELAQKPLARIYSRRAILGFSIFFAPVFAGVLLRQNLIDTQRKREANMVLIISIAFTAITLTIVTIADQKTNVPSYLINILWGVLLSEFFHKKYFPGDHYEYKKIWKPLLFSALILVVLAITAFFLLQES